MSDGSFQKEQDMLSMTDLTVDACLSDKMECLDHQVVEFKYLSNCPGMEDQLARWCMKGDLALVDIFFQLLLNQTSQILNGFSWPIDFKQLALLLKILLLLAGTWSISITIRIPILFKWSVCWALGTQKELNDHALAQALRTRSTCLSPNYFSWSSCSVLRGISEIHVLTVIFTYSY